MLQTKYDSIKNWDVQMVAIGPLGWPLSHVALHNVFMFDLVSLPCVVVATDDEKIAECCQGFGADVIMTSESCQNGRSLGYHHVANFHAMLVDLLT